MTPNPITATPETTIAEAARLMLHLKIGAVPVVENGVPVGIISTSDILQRFLEVAKSDQMIQLIGQTVGHGHMKF